MIPSKPKHVPALEDDSPSVCEALDEVASRPLSTPPPSSSPTFAGVPDALVRSLLRYAGREGVAIESVNTRLGVAAPRVLQELIARGLVGATEVNGRHAHTLRGREWTALPPEKLYRLASAQRAATGLLHRMATLHGRLDALFMPDRAVMFGEILTKAPLLRSVDVGIDLVLARNAAERAQAGKGRDVRRCNCKTTPAEWLAARERGVWAFLGARSPVLRLLPLAGDRWPHGVEVWPSDTSERLLRITP